MTEIIPAILEKEWREVEYKLSLVEGKSPWVQIDVSDGKFTPHATWRNPDDLWKLPPSTPDEVPARQLHVELHLMVERPWEVMDAWLHSRAERLVFHIETIEDKAEHLEHIEELINQIKTKQKHVGVALNPGTPWQHIERYVSAVEHILFLGVEPGASGQQFEPSVLEKIASFHAAYPNVIIAVDGGVTLEMARHLKNAGAHRLISSSFIFSHRDPVDGIEALRRVLGEGDSENQ